MPFFQSAIDSYIGSENERTDYTLNLLNNNAQVLLLNRPLSLSFVGQDIDTLINYEVPQTGNLASVTWTRTATASGLSYGVGNAIIAASASGDRLFNAFAILGQFPTAIIPEDVTVQVGVTTNILNILSGSKDITDRERLIRNVETVLDVSSARFASSFDINPAFAGTVPSDIITVTRYGNVTHAIFEYSNNFTIPQNQTYNLTVGGWTLEVTS